MSRSLIAAAAALAFAGCALAQNANGVLDGQRQIQLALKVLF